MEIIIDYNNKKLTKKNNFIEDIVKLMDNLNNNFDDLVRTLNIEEFL